jgi:muramoyltetrapeptide carboxypeptidase LdcA involved in peptidoglycan recycling
MQQRESITPPRLRPGDGVAIVNPSLALPGADPLASLAPALHGLAATGLRPRLMPHVGQRWTPPELVGQSDAPALAGSDDERAADLNAALRDPDTRLVQAVWGGGGARRLLRPGLIDWAALAADPKLLCGFSDFAHLALAVHARLGLVTIDGPSAFQWAAAPSEPMIGQARAVLMEAAPFGPLPAAEIWYASQLPPGAPGTPPTRARPGGWRWLRTGTATGPLIAALPGVLLTLLDLGLAPSLAGAIWCLDSYRQTAAHLATDLAALRARGALDGLVGLVMARPWPGAGRDAPALDDTVLAATANLDPAPPVLADADTGHTWPKWTLPNGVIATLESATDRFALAGAAVR